MIVLQSLMEGLRSLVGLKGWDYCVVWKFREDQRLIQWMDCCCSGAENCQNCTEEHLFLVSAVLPCKDVTFPHPKTKACDLLAQFPLSVSLDSGNIHAQTLISNQPRWINFNNSSDLFLSEERVGTRLLIPMPGGLIELFVAKQKPEDPEIIDFVMAQCSITIEQDFKKSENGFLQKNFDGLVQQFASSLNIRPKNEMFFELPPGFNSSLENGLMVESTMTKELGPDKNSIKQENGQVDCSDQVADNDDGIFGKNYIAERKRRKKLNERLFTLRALVPKITKLDRASIIGDAIDFIKELQKKVRDLGDELKEPNNEDGAQTHENEPLSESKTGINDHHGTRFPSNNNTIESKNSSQNTVINDEKAQQIEVQLELTQIDGNKFYLKVFWEHRPGGFVKLMEAMNALGLEVTNANVTTFRGLVLNIFKLEKRDNELVQPDHVRESLLELLGARNLP